MTKEQFNKEYLNIDNFTEKLGEELIDTVMEDDNFGCDMARSVICVFDDCSTKREFELANRMLIAICGYGIDTIVDRIKEKDTQGYRWESC